jgi:hypothetical protein
VHWAGSGPLLLLGRTARQLIPQTSDDWSVGQRYPRNDPGRERPTAPSKNPLPMVFVASDTHPKVPPGAPSFVLGIPSYASRLCPLSTAARSAVAYNLPYCNLCTRDPSQGEIRGEGKGSKRRSGAQRAQRKPISEPSSDRPFHVRIDVRIPAEGSLVQLQPRRTRSVLERLTT